jgi:hypothetical protein
MGLYNIITSLFRISTSKVDNQNKQSVELEVKEKEKKTTYSSWFQHAAKNIEKIPKNKSITN